MQHYIAKSIGTHTQSGVTLNAELEPKNSSTNTNDLYIWVILFVVTVWKCLFFSSKEGVPVLFVHIMNVQVIGVW